MRGIELGMMKIRSSACVAAAELPMVVDQVFDESTDGHVHEGWR